MPSTPILGLYYPDKDTDGDKNFNTDTMLKENWVKIDTALAAKAPIDSPRFTGIPEGPTAALGTDSKQLASTEFVKASVAAAAVDITVLAPKNNPIFTGVVTLPGDPTGALHATPKQWVEAQIALAKKYAP